MPNEAGQLHGGDADQAEQGPSDWDAIVDNGGEESAVAVQGQVGLLRQITPRVLLDATTSPDKAAANGAFDAMMPMKKSTSL